MIVHTRLKLTDKVVQALEHIKIGSSNEKPKFNKVARRRSMRISTRPRLHEKQSRLEPNHLEQPSRSSKSLARTGE